MIPYWDVDIHMQESILYFQEPYEKGGLEGLHGGCNVALGGGCGGRRPSRIFFSLFFADFVGKKERKRGLGRSPKDFATTMGGTSSPKK